MDKFFSRAPEIIREAAKSTLGVVSLVVIAISLLALTFFTTASENIRVGIFILIFIGASRSMAMQNVLASTLGLLGELLGYKAVLPQYAGE